MLAISIKAPAIHVCPTAPENYCGNPLNLFILTDLTFYWDKSVTSGPDDTYFYVG
jgi:hypothetical protein